MAPPEAEPRKPADYTPRTVVLATVGIVVIMGLAVLYVAAVAPILHANAVLRDTPTHIIGFWEESSVANQPHVQSALTRLGGTDAARERLGTYANLPRWLAPYREKALFLLGFCGIKATPVLVRALDSPDTTVQAYAFTALRRMEPLPAEAVPAIRRMLADRMRYLGDPGYEFVVDLIRALGEIGPAASDAVPDLDAILRNKEQRPAYETMGIARAAREALRKIRGEGRPKE